MSHQHRQGLRENPLAGIEAQAEPDGHQGGAHGRQESRGPARRAGRHAGSPAWPCGLLRPRRPRPARGPWPGRRPAAAAGPRPARRSGRRGARGSPTGGGPRPRCPPRPARPVPGDTSVTPARAAENQVEVADPGQQQAPERPGPGPRQAGLGPRRDRGRRPRIRSGSSCRPAPERRSAHRRANRPERPGRWPSASARRRVAARARRAAASVHASQAQLSTPRPTASNAIRRPSPRPRGRRARRTARPRAGGRGCRPARPGVWPGRHRPRPHRSATAWPRRPAARARREQAAGLDRQPG